jgi:hypothetical protein
MRWNAWLLGLVAFVVLLAPPRTVQACPNCRDAVPQTSGAEEDDQLREARAYNSSIYLMVAMPYLMLGALGFVIYRGIKQHAAAQQRWISPEGERSNNN